MKQIIQIPALVEATSSDDMVEASISLSVDNGQITLEIPEWESRIEIPAEHLTKALATLAPTEKEPAISPVLVQHLGQKISRLEQQIAATPQQRLELEAMGENLEALRREVLPRLEVLEKEHVLTGQIAASLQGQINSLGERITGTTEVLQNTKDRVDTLEIEQDEQDEKIALLLNNLAEPPAETAALALYGGEQ